VSVITRRDKVRPSRWKLDLLQEVSLISSICRFLQEPSRSNVGAVNFLVWISSRSSLSGGFSWRTSGTGHSWHSAAHRFRGLFRYGTGAASRCIRDCRWHWLRAASQAATLPRVFSPDSVVTVEVAESTWVKSASEFGWFRLVQTHSNYPIHEQRASFQISWTRGSEQ
jgi:hypothetical protein